MLICYDVASHLKVSNDLQNSFAICRKEVTLASTLQIAANYWWVKIETWGSSWNSNESLLLVNYGLTISSVVSSFPQTFLYSCLAGNIGIGHEKSSWYLWFQEDDVHCRRNICIYA